MRYQLYLGPRLYFSWSLAAYLMFEKFGLSQMVDITILRPETEAGVGPLLARLAPARTLPTAVTPEGTVLSDSMAIAEELASRHPEAALWPADPAQRGLARTLAAEMHAGFHGLRGRWPVNLRTGFAPQVPDAAVTGELERLETIWAAAHDRRAAEGPWLLGAYSLADAIFAPMALRLAVYGFDTRPITRAYVATHLADRAVRRWRATALATETALPAFEPDLPARPWPGPAPRVAHAVANGPAENATCPYSGRPVTHFMAMDGRVFGFCNPACRDKTVTDPAAWPAFMAICGES